MNKKNHFRRPGRKKMKSRKKSSVIHKMEEVRPNM